MNQAVIKTLKASAYKIPTDYPESDGTIKWNSTTLILAEAEAEGIKGIGYSYAPEAALSFIKNKLEPVVVHADGMNIPAIYENMISVIRNDGSCGMATMAVSAVDSALWDLKAKILQLPLTALLGTAKNDLPLYGSGGFTSYPIEKLQRQLGGWAEKGFKQVKMKIGREPEKDVQRVRAAREAIGDQTGLFVDANGAYSVRQALEKAKQFADLGVTWFEEPVPSANLKGLHFIRQHVPAGMNIAIGEYGYNLYDFEKILSAGAADVLQADATRCGGISGFLNAGNLCAAFQLPFSSHCAPHLHLHAALSLANFYTAEYFYDHVRIENMLFEGTQQPEKGVLHPGSDRPGLGLKFKYRDAEKYKIK